MNISYILYFVVPATLGAIIIITGAILLAVDARRKKKAGEVETADWLSTGGKIVSVQLNRHEARKDDTSGTHIDINFEPIVEYVYTVDNQEYRSTNVFPGDHIYFSEQAAQEILDEHPVNKYVPVNYDPKDPKNSSIENRPETQNKVHLAGMILTIFGVLVCCFTSFMTFIIVGKVM